MVGQTSTCCTSRSRAAVNVVAESKGELGGTAKCWKVVFVGRPCRHTVVQSLVQLCAFSHWQTSMWWRPDCTVSAANTLQAFLKGRSQYRKGITPVNIRSLSRNNVETVHLQPHTPWNSDIAVHWENDRVIVCPWSISYTFIWKFLASFEVCNAFFIFSLSYQGQLHLPPHHCLCLGFPPQFKFENLQLAYHYSSFSWNRWFTERWQVPARLATINSGIIRSE